MRCPRCSADNPGGMKFCGHCGAALGEPCPSCGYGNPPEHRFCGQCGAPLAIAGFEDSASPEPFAHKLAAARPADGKTALPGEMKQVTVLFCDIVGSTPLTERLGPEAMRDLVSSFLATSLAEVRRFGGTASQFAGDGFMALFGAPVAQEDHVQRALLAALAIQRALGGSGDEDKTEKLDLPVRIGIHTGPVVFGPLADNLLMDPTAIGDTANLAKRLQEAAEPATILLSETTYQLAQSYAEVRPVGPLMLKGIAEPKSTYRLLGISQQRAALRASAAARTTTFVDRHNDLAILHNFLHQVEAGRRQIVGIVGEPGIGKSRLLNEFRKQLGPERVIWIEGRCVSYGTAIPYLLVLDLLRSNCGVVETDTPEAIIEKVGSGLQQAGIDAEREGPVLLHLLGVSDAGALPALANPETLKARAFQILCQISTNLSLQRPLVLVLEDLHWIDKTSEEFLGFLAENTAEARILVLGTYRPGYRTPWLEKSYAGQTPLPPLSRDDSVQMVRSVLRTERLADLVTREIVGKGEGNPFFLEQLALHAGEALRSNLMVPDTIHDVVMARIDRLPAEAKELLQIAAVIGREFSPRLLGAVWPREAAFEPQLAELSRLEFVDERAQAEGSVYVFRHALTQETAYGGLLERQRRAYHGAIGHALEELYTGRIDEVAEMLAFHFGRSDEAEKAVDYSVLAAEKAQRRWANNEALAYFTDALRRLDAMPDNEANRLRRIDAVLKQAEVKFAFGQHAEQIQALDQIAGLVDQTDDASRRATWHYWQGFLQILTGGRPNLAIDHCNIAARLAGAAGLDEVKAFADSCLAQVYLTAGRLRDAIESGERALAGFEFRGNLWWASRTLWHLAQAAIYLGEWDASLTYCSRAVAHGTTLNDLRLKVVGLYRTGSAYVHQGDIERGLRYCDDALALKPIPYDAAMAKVFRGYGQIKAGRLDIGIAELREAIAWLERSRLSHVRLAPALRLAEGYLLGGETAAARSLIEDVLSRSRANGYCYLEGLANRLMAECLADAAPASAMQHAAEAQRILKAIAARNDLAKTMVTRARLSQGSGDFAEARSLLEEAKAIFDTLGTIDEPARARAALAAFDRGAPIRPLGRTS